jgi:putative transcription factor
MCGAQAKLFRAMIEGTQMDVCRDCSKFGKVIAEVKEEPKKEKPKKEEVPARELIQVIVEDYAEKIKKGREKLGLKQEEFARKLNEKESLIQKIETGSFEPSISLARKLEKILKIRLVEQHEEVRQKGTATKDETFTIGDFIKVKR